MLRAENSEQLFSFVAKKINKNIFHKSSVKSCWVEVFGLLTFQTHAVKSWACSGSWRSTSSMSHLDWQAVFFPAIICMDEARRPPEVRMLVCLRCSSDCFAKQRLDSYASLCCGAESAVESQIKTKGSPEEEALTVVLPEESWVKTVFLIQSLFEIRSCLLISPQLKLFMLAMHTQKKKNWCNACSVLWTLLFFLKFKLIQFKHIQSNGKI